MLFTSHQWGKAKLVGSQTSFHSSSSFIVSLFCFSRLISWTFSSQSLGPFLSALYSHTDLGSELWPRSRQEAMGCCCNGKSHLIRDNIKGDFLLSSCPVYLTRCSIQPYAEGQTKSSRCLGNLSRAPWPFWIWAGCSFCSFSYNTQEIVWKHLIRTKHCAQWGLIFNHRSSRWGS